jgi:hypothetical protein
MTAMLNCILFLLYLLASCGDHISKNVKVVDYLCRQMYSADSYEYYAYVHFTSIR